MWVGIVSDLRSAVRDIGSRGLRLPSQEARVFVLFVRRLACDRSRGLMRWLTKAFNSYPRTTIEKTHLHWLYYIAFPGMMVPIQ